MSGTYNYNPKVEHPNNIFLQSASDGGRPFYFGASQVPIMLNLPDHSITRKEEFTKGYMEGKGLTGQMTKSSNIRMPGYMGITRYVLVSYSDF